MRFSRQVVVGLILMLLSGFSGESQAKKRPKKGRRAGIAKKIPAKQSQPSVFDGKLLVRVEGKGNNVSVVMKPNGLYLAPCVLGTERGILPLWEPQPTGRKNYAVTCISSVDHRSRLSFSVQCLGSRIDNQSAAYPLDHEFILRLECLPS